MEVKELDLPGVLEIIPKVFYDERGHFFESYNFESFKSQGITTKFVQDNQSFSKAGVVRGLHFQAPPFAQIKLVRALQGKVLDIVLDCRKSSPTYGKYTSIILDSSLNNMVYIPEGFAHGFSAFEDSVFQYKCSNIYVKQAEMGVHPLDSVLSIDWKVSNPNVSQKDMELPDFHSFSSPFQ